MKFIVFAGNYAFFFSSPWVGNLASIPEVLCELSSQSLKRVGRSSQTEATSVQDTFPTPAWPPIQAHSLSFSPLLRIAVKPASARERRSPRPMRHARARSVLARHARCASITAWRKPSASIRTCQLRQRVRIPSACTFCFLQVISPEPCNRL